MNISRKHIMLVVFLLSSLVLAYTISNRVYACGGGGSSPDGIALKLRGVSNLAEAIKLKRLLYRRTRLSNAQMSVRIRQRYVSPYFVRVQSQKNRLLKQLKTQAVTPHCLTILLLKLIIL